MKCFCQDCGEVFHEDPNFEGNLFDLLGTECPEWVKKALCHMVGKNHEVVMVLDVETNSVPLSFSKLAETLGLTRESIIMACLGEGLL